MALLARLAASGKIVMASVHQPSDEVFHSFTSFVLLADGKARAPRAARPPPVRLCWMGGSFARSASQ